MTRPFSMVACLAALSLALASCGGSSDTATTSTSAAPAAQTTSPKSKVKFVTPRNGATVGSSFTAKVKLTHFRIDPKAVGKAPAPGVGHLHFMLDGGKFDYPRFSGPNGKIGKQLGVTGNYSPALEPTITYRHIPAGRYKLTVILANNNHTPTGVQATSTITVR
jgi:hypothetical protein